MRGVLEKVLIANRGAIACRIIRTLRRLHISSVAVFSEADASSLHVAQADEAMCIGPAPASKSYMNAMALIAAANECGAQAIHPGYGFLSENAEFAAQCETSGLIFIGPTAQNMRSFGLKHTAREIARDQSVPLVPGSSLLTDLDGAREAARRIGFPLMLKASGGGGGIGMRACVDMAALEAAFPIVSRLAASHFADSGVYLERFLPQARHVEVQVFGNGTGRVVALGERDCSLQRRHQKIIEEAPAPELSGTLRAALAESAIRLTSTAAYRSAGTVEFLLDARREEFYFLEVNTRLQVEHAVTEEVTGVDLIEWMVQGAAGDYSFMEEWAAREAVPATHGCSIQARLYAEDPGEDNRPSSGTVTHAQFPHDVRVETWVAAGTEVSTHYDPLLAKIIVNGTDRTTAVAALQRALDATHIAGLETNLDWLRQIVRTDMFVSGNVSTHALASVPYAQRSLRVLSGGLATTVQDYPGRRGYWHVGVPPSGPMDCLAFRLGNRLLGNPEGAPGLEVTALGPTLLFNSAATICVAGADCDPRLDGLPVAAYTATAVVAGQTLKLGRVIGPGLRAYVLFGGGLDESAYLGSRSTFTLGRFGGHAGRNLAAGDVLHHSASAGMEAQPVTWLNGYLPTRLQPTLTRGWRVRVLYGPHGAPDFFTSADIDVILSASWKVHYNSNRTGVRLIGPKPQWARRDGGEAGLHPSNIHDNAYAVGAIDFTGDMPIILGPDGPSLGGFVCPFVVISADLWKLGQLAPGDSLQFECVDEGIAREAECSQDAWIAGRHRTPPPARRTAALRDADAILATVSAHEARPRTLYRRQGDRHVLIEYGPIVLDLTLRLRVHALMLELERVKPSGIIDVTPGIRSLQIHYDPDVLPLERLLRTVGELEDRLGNLDHFEIPSRTVWLPLSFNDPAVAETIERYMSSVRADAPWCPDNIEFIRRINGLHSVEDVRNIVFAARYLVLGLGDVYLGAPVAVPLDPRHRLVTTKYNPARTWTPPNVVGIGGAYLCIYGMEGPGGYQLFGRTVQVWNSYPRSAEFREHPWLLRFFDQIRFFPVTHAELTDWRRDFPYGRRPLRIETETFRLADYERFLNANHASIEAFQTTRRAAFDAEREAWARRSELSSDKSLPEAAPVPDATQIPHGAELIEAPLGGHVWRIEVRQGDRIEKGSVIAAIEAMKTECSVPSPSGGIVRAVYIQEGQAVAPGMPLIAVEPDASSPVTGAT